MNANYINPFITSTRSVFATMLACEVVREAPTLKQNRQPDYEISGIIGLSGKAAGTVVLSLSRNAALGAAEAMLGEKPDGINADVVDVIGELTNMIAGGAKAQLEQYQMSVSLPSVISGKNHTVDFPSQVKPISIPFDSPWGPLSVQVGLVEQPQEQLAAT